MPTLGRNLLNGTEFRIRVCKPASSTHLTHSFSLKLNAEARLDEMWPVLQFRVTVSIAAFISSFATAFLEEAAKLGLLKRVVTFFRYDRHPEIRADTLRSVRTPQNNPEGYKSSSVMEHPST